MYFLSPLKISAFIGILCVSLLNGASSSQDVFSDKDLQKAIVTHFGFFSRSHYSEENVTYTPRLLWWQGETAGILIKENDSIIFHPLELRDPAFVSGGPYAPLADPVLRGQYDQFKEGQNDAVSEFYTWFKSPSSETLNDELAENRYFLDGLTWVIGRNNSESERNLDGRPQSLITRAATMRKQHGGLRFNFGAVPSSYEAKEHLVDQFNIDFCYLLTVEKIKA